MAAKKATPKPNSRRDELWERAPESAYPILAYRLMPTSLPVFKSHRRKKADKIGAYEQYGFEFQGFDVSAADDADETNKHFPYVMRLPYTYEALINRIQDGRDIPQSYREFVYGVEQDEPEKTVDSK